MGQPLRPWCKADLALTQAEQLGQFARVNVAVGLAAWEPQMSAADLLARAHTAAQHQNGEDPPAIGDRPARLAGGAAALLADDPHDIRATAPPIGPDGSS